MSFKAGLYARWCHFLSLSALQSGSGHTGPWAVLQTCSCRILPQIFVEWINKGEFGSLRSRELQINQQLFLCLPIWIPESWQRPDSKNDAQQSSGIPPRPWGHGAHSLWALLLPSFCSSRSIISHLPTPGAHGSLSPTSPHLIHTEVLSPASPHLATPGTLTHLWSIQPHWHWVFVQKFPPGHEMLPFETLLQPSPSVSIKCPKAFVKVKI